MDNNTVTILNEEFENDKTGEKVQDGRRNAVACLARPVRGYQSHAFSSQGNLAEG